MLQSPNSQELSTTIHPNAANYDEASLPQRSHVHGTNSTTSHLKITTSMTNILNVSQVIYIFTNSTMRRRKCHEPRRVVCVTQQRWSHELNDGSCKYHKLVRLPRVLLWMSHVTQISESCHIYEWVMSHVWTGQGTNMQAETWVSSSSNGPITPTKDHVTHMNESLHAHGWVMPHICRPRHEFLPQAMALSHTHMMNEACHTCEYTYEWVLLHIRVMSHVWMSHVIHMQV